MDRRKLARRKEKLAQVREQQSRVAHALAAKAVRDKMMEIDELVAAHESEEARVHEERDRLGAGWFDLIERSRQRHRDTLEKLERELESLQAVELDRKGEHRITLETLRSSEKVTEKVVRLWREEANQKEAKSLDEVGGRMTRKSESSED